MVQTQATLPQPEVMVVTLAVVVAAMRQQEQEELLEMVVLVVVQMVSKADMVTPVLLIPVAVKVVVKWDMLVVTVVLESFLLMMDQLLQHSPQLGLTQSPQTEM